MKKPQARNTIVTGGVQGIGKSIVHSLIARGDTVHVVDCVAPDDLRVNHLQQLGVQYHHIDITHTADIKLLFEGIEEPINLLVNNAGITRDNLAVRLKEEDWDAVQEVNLKGAFFCAQQAIKKMMRQQVLCDETLVRGYIINISSVVALTGNPGQVNYVASKAGLIGMSKTLAHEYGTRGILVNAVAPGFIQTAMTEKLPEKNREQAREHTAVKRLGKPEDVAEVVSFLSSGKADYVTGQVLEVSGGIF